MILTSWDIQVANPTPLSSFKNKNSAGARRKFFRVLCLCGRHFPMARKLYALFWRIFLSRLQFIAGRVGGGFKESGWCRAFFFWPDLFQKHTRLQICHPKKHFRKQAKPQMVPVPTKTQLSNFLGTPGEDYFKRKPEKFKLLFSGDLVG